MIATYVIWVSQDMERLSTGKLGSGLFPMAVGVCLFVSGVVLGIQSLYRLVPFLVRKNQQESIGISTDPETLNRGVKAVAILGLVVFYMYAVEVAGFPLTMILIAYAIQRLLGGARMTSLVAAVVISGILWGVFEKLLLVQLPNGWVGF